MNKRRREHIIQNTSGKTRDNSKILVFSSLLTLTITLLGNYFINDSNHKHSLNEALLTQNIESYHFEKEYLLNQILQCKNFLYEYNQVFTECFNAYLTSTLKEEKVRFDAHDKINEYQVKLEELELKIKDYLVVLNVGQNKVNEKYSKEFIELYRDRNHWLTDIEIIENLNLVNSIFLKVRDILIILIHYC